MRESTVLLVSGIATLFVACLLLLAVISISCNQGSIASDATPSDQAAVGPTITVYKTSTCGCCTKWVEHARDAGFDVTAIEVSDRELQRIKVKNGVPRPLTSCHTALVDEYVVEGHVPAEDVVRLLEERPKVAGLTAPGMPMGSPGMEGPTSQGYVVYAFDASGKTSPFARHGP